MDSSVVDHVASRRICTRTAARATARTDAATSGDREADDDDDAGDDNDEKDDTERPRGDDSTACFSKRVKNSGRVASAAAIAGESAQKFSNTR